MIALRLTVPMACWRKAHAREFVESELLPPPATCYGALLSLVGEIDRDRHRGCRITAGYLHRPEASTVLRTFWQIKDREETPGNSQNAGPDLQQLMLQSDLILWCDSGSEPSPETGLESRVKQALLQPDSVERFGGWSLGESTHLINDVWLLPDARPPGPCHAFVLDLNGDLTLPVWVDHVGAAGTRYATGRLQELSEAPDTERIPSIPLAELDTAPPRKAPRQKRR